MVYVKQLELTNFKSFGSTTVIPLLPGFTVVSGPNGSGKSNLLDALLFALGLAGSKGMRAERLPDLVNHSQTRKGQAVIETRVTVVFDLEGAALQLPNPNCNREANDDINSNNPEPTQATPTTPAAVGQGSVEPGANSELPQIYPPTFTVNEFKVTRRLRVTKQGTYTSTYAVNDQPCTLNELHEQLGQLRIYPEGYNVVLQGDVTGIISMNARQRREIIDELAGVADFDRKINQAKEKLDTVKEREDKFRIVEAELIEQRDRLARDKVQAEKYQKLRQELLTKEQWEGWLLWREGQKQIQNLQAQLQNGEQTQRQLRDQLATTDREIAAGNKELERLNAAVKALGEEELLKLQATQAAQVAELRQLERQQQERQQQGEALLSQMQQLQTDMQTWLSELDTLAQTQQEIETQELSTFNQQRDQAQHELTNRRAAASNLATAAEDWVQQQSGLRQQIEALLQGLDPQRSEQARLLERDTQLEKQLQEQTAVLGELETEHTEKQTRLEAGQAELEQQTQQVQSLAEITATTDRECQTLQETQARLQRELRDGQRQLDKLEAQSQAQQEAQGTGASRLILKANLKGVCGLVAQLGRVEPQFQLALEIAAGNRLGNIVVDDDTVAAAGIEILKRERGGRATFLPLNKIQAPRSLPGLHASGAIDYALNLIEFEQRYEPIFAYVFGNTVVFSTLDQARRHLGQFRMVTLDGDLLEATGAMTGGSRPQQTGIHFGTAEAGETREVSDLRQRLAEIEHLLEKLDDQIAKAQTGYQKQAEALTLARQTHRELQLRLEQLTSEVKTLHQRCEQLRQQVQQTQTELGTTQTRLQILETELPQQEARLSELRLALSGLEESQTHSEWQQIQRQIQAQEVVLQEREQAVRTCQQRLQELELQRQRLQERIQQAQATLQNCRQQQTAQQQQQKADAQQQATLQANLAQIQTQLAEIEQNLGTQKQARDTFEQQLRQQQTARQQLDWQLQKQIETAQEQQQQLVALQEQVQSQAAQLAGEAPEMPEDLDLEQLRNELRSIQKRMQALEPVNMLAIEEYDRTQTRLQELTEKLETLEQERTELLLRIENFTTLRHQAFREAFEAVNANFQVIFAELSEGDGYLQLEHTEDPFAGGLNLVAHPKGKPVQRLASMSGGEKSLTALSFIFALQRYRPSPFYAFDEVDMFLDGANVERLSRMIQKQAQAAQFLVVSLRRPMIEAAERTIGVTQARGTHTQVIGLQLRSAATG